MTDGKIVTDLRGVSATMDTKCKAHEKKEAFCQERTQKAKERIATARQKISAMHEKRADKEQLIERNEIKIKETYKRLQTMEHRIELSRQSMRIEVTSSNDLMAVQKQVKDAFMKQSELQAKIIRGERRKDALEKHVQSVQDKGTRYRERMRNLVDRLKYLVNRQEEVKKSIRDKVANIKSMHAKIMALEPQLRDSFTRMRKIEVDVFELDDKINRKEDMIRHIHKETLYKRDEAERARVEFEVKQDRKFKGSDAIINLTRE